MARNAERFDFKREGRVFTEDSVRLIVGGPSSVVCPQSAAVGVLNIAANMLTSAVDFPRSKRRVPGPKLGPSGTTVDVLTFKGDSRSTKVDSQKTIVDAQRIIVHS